MITRDLSDKVKEICSANYKNNCGQCVLRPVCCKSFILTEQSHVKWVNDLNELAENVELSV